MDREKERAMRRVLLEDLATAHRVAIADLASRLAAGNNFGITREWVRDAAWTHRASDDFPGCTE